MTNADARPIALVGLMGAGKSTVARALGERLGTAVADLDAMVEAERGCRIAELFAREGEAAFRRLEGRVLRQVLGAGAGAGVIACGGGTVLDPGHRRLLAERCRVVWLEVSAAGAARRLAVAEEQRPLLLAAAAEPGADPVPRLEALLAERRPFYEEVAQARVTVDGRTVDEVADEVLGALGKRAG